MRRFLPLIAAGAVFFVAVLATAWPRPDVPFFSQGYRDTGVEMTPAGTPVATNTAAATNTPEETWTPGATRTETPVATETPVPTETPTPGAAPTCITDDDCRLGCCGDCNQDGVTTGGEFTICNEAVATDGVVPENCLACDCNGNNIVEVADLLVISERALNGCPITGTCP